jgi:hypothetical protein
MKTYPLEHVADEFCGDHEPASVRWVADQIRAKRFTAIKVRGHWRMSDEDIEAAVEVCRNRPRPAPPANADESRVLSFTKTSSRRVAS